MYRLWYLLVVTVLCLVGPHSVAAQSVARHSTFAKLNLGVISRLYSLSNEQRSTAERIMDSVFSQDIESTQGWVTQRRSSGATVPTDSIRKVRMATEDFDKRFRRIFDASQAKKFDSIRGPKRPTSP